MSRRALEPGQHGRVFVAVTRSGMYKARTRVRLRSGDLEMVTFTAATSELAGRGLQAEIDRRLKAAPGSADLGPRDPFAKAARQWVEQARIESEWPDPPLRPQTVDEYEDLLRLYVVPAPDPQVRAFVRWERHREHDLDLVARLAGGEPSDDALEIVERRWAPSRPPWPDAWSAAQPAAA